MPVQKGHSLLRNRGHRIVWGPRVEDIAETVGRPEQDFGVEANAHARLCKPLLTDVIAPLPMDLPERWQPKPSTRPPQRAGAEAGAGIEP